MGLADQIIAASDSPLRWAQAHYRLAVPGLIAFALGFLVWVKAAGVNDLWLLAVSEPPYLLAVVLTFRRLEAHGRSGWWIILMIAAIRIGPEVYSLTIGVLFNLLPVALAWREPEVGVFPAEA